MKLLVKDIDTVVSCDESDNVYKNVNILFENGVIKSIGKEVRDADEIIDGKNFIMYPGLINTHHHMYQTFTRNLPQVQNLELFDWLLYLYEIWKDINVDIVKMSSYTALSELLLYGTTTVFDHHYVFPSSSSKKLIDEQFKVAKELGIRFHASRGSMSLSKKDGGLPPDSVVQSEEEILEDCKRLIHEYHNPNFNSMTQVVLAPCSPFSVTDKLMKLSAKLAREHGVRLHTHLAETIDEENYTLKHFNLRPLEYMRTLDWVGDDVWYAHGIHFNDSELQLLADTQTGVAHCPISNMKLSSGVAKIPKMLELGVKVGLAVDGSASNDGSNMLEEIRVAYLLHRLNSSRQAPSGYDILKLATNGSASLLGRDDIGRLEIGLAGDAFMIDKNDISMIGSQFDYKSVLGTIGHKKRVAYTIVNGKIVVKNGKLANADEQEIAKESNRLINRLIS